MTDSHPADSPPDLGARATYRYFNRHVIRFADLDPAGHVNHLAYAQYFESARVAFWHDAGRHVAVPNTTGVIATLTIDYRAEMDFPGEVEVGTRILEIGNSSTRMAHGLFRDGVCMATRPAVSVLLDLETRRPMPVPGALREAVMALSEGR